MKTNEKKEFSRRIWEKKFSDQELLDDLINISKKLNKDSITIKDYTLHGNYTFKLYYIRFGDWNNALKRAGLNFNNSQVASDEDYIINLDNIYRTLGRFPVVTDCDKPFSKYRSYKYVRRFGSWKNASKALMEYLDNDDNIMLENDKLNYMKSLHGINISENDMINDIIRVSKMLKMNSITRFIYSKHGKYRLSAIIYKFGNWNKAIKKAGLTKINNMNISVYNLLDNFRDIYLKFGKLPERRDYIRLSTKYSYSMYVRRFGSWDKAIEEFEKYMENFKDNKSGNDKL